MRTRGTGCTDAAASSRAGPAQIERQLMEDTKAFAELEKREWSDPAVAGAYAEGFAHASDMVAPHLASAVSADPGTEALDLCCGHGSVSAALLARGAQVTGLDFSPAMLSIARSKAPGATFIEGDAIMRKVVEYHGTGPKWTIPMPSVVISAEAV